ncbi:MAG TPA: PIG-L family deacetylase [Kofleriaceae bacterium]
MRTWLCSVVALAASACGDNLFPDSEPIVAATDLAIVAHQDDDLLFMQPDLYDAVKRGTGVTNVYVTAGNGRHGRDFSERRYDGLMTAYSAIAGANDWSCGWIRVGSNEVEHCRLESAKVSLLFLGYPDGGKDGELALSLLHLWEGKVPRAPAVSFGPATYDRPTLIAVLSDIIGYTQPTTIRTLEIASTHGHDHSDHMLVGALAVLAIARSSVDAELISYRGYNINDEPPNASPALYRRSLDAVARYEACITGCAPCGEACPANRIVDTHLEWLKRHYAIGVRRVVDGKLRLDGRCLDAAAGAPVRLVDCASAPAWHLDVHGNLMTDAGLCLHVGPDGELTAGATCDDPEGGARTRFFYDDEGHLWSGAPPAAADDMSFAHLDCMISDGGQPRTALCGADRAPRWEFGRATTATARATTTITRTGRAVRMAKLPRRAMPMLCAVEVGARGLMCAPSTTAGGLLPAIRVDSQSAPLAIEPESLALGDVDGDGLNDACGRDAGGILCATAAGSYQAVRWSAALGAIGPASPTDRSLTITRGGNICGLAPTGVVCVAMNDTAVDVRSTWPDRAAALWIADLDGDGDPDWCAATADGPACSLAADRKLATDGALWGYASGGVTEASTRVGALPDTATAVFTDVDGDGRDDLCTVRDGAIACARSLGRGFGPQIPVARLPDGLAPSAVWAEPSKAPGVPRLCAADATTIACTDD